MQSFAVIDPEFCHFVRRTPGKRRETSKPKVRPEFTDATRHQIGVFIQFGRAASGTAVAGSPKRRKSSSCPFTIVCRTARISSRSAGSSFSSQAMQSRQALDQVPLGRVALLRGKIPQGLGDRGEIQFAGDDAGQSRARFVRRIFDRNGRLYPPSCR